MACLRWLCHFRIFSLVPLQRAIPYCTVAALAKVSESQLKSVARMAITDGLFYEPCPNCIGHSATSTLLATNQNLHGWAVFMCETSAPTAAKLVEASERWPNSVDKSQTAFNVAFQTDLPFFQHLAGNPERTQQFAGYMKSVTNSEGTHVKHLLAGFDWASLGQATIVDVCCSHSNYPLPPPLFSSEPLSLGPSWANTWMIDHSGGRINGAR